METWKDWLTWFKGMHLPVGKHLYLSVLYLIHKLHEHVPSVSPCLSIVSHPQTPWTCPICISLFQYCISSTNSMNMSHLYLLVSVLYLIHKLHEHVPSVSPCLSIVSHPQTQLEKMSQQFTYQPSSLNCNSNEHNVKQTLLPLFTEVQTQ